MFIQTEATPNPATLKFLPGRDVLPSGTLEVTDADEAKKSPLAEGLFSVPGVTGVFFGQDFITVTKRGDLDWQHLKPAVLGAIMDHYLKNKPILAEGVTAVSGTDEDGEFFDPEDAALVGTIKELLDTRVRPAVAQDGGDITFKGFKEGVVFLNMKGSCAGCPSSTATLKQGIENLLRHFVPEVSEVRPV